MSTTKTRWFKFVRWVMLLGLMAWNACGVAQDSANRTESPSPGSHPDSHPESLTDSAADSVRELRDEVRELQAAVAGMRSDWQRARAETEELRRELDEVRAGTEPRNAVVTGAVAKAESTDSEAGGESTQDRLRNVLQNSAQEDQEQDRKKGEHAASLEEEYQLLSGKVDDQYQTKVESASKYKLRLSGIVLMNLVSNQGWVDSIDLPTLAGPRPAGDSGGSFRATLRQSEIRVEHRGVLGEDSSLIFQGGILDPVSGETPGAGYNRQAGPGESSRQPAYATRVAWTHDVFGQPLRVGLGGFYSRQDYGFSRTVNGWAGMTDIELPLSHQFSLSGKLYRGRALGGLYGGIGRSVLFSGDPTLASTQVPGLNSVGGWAQLKYRPADQYEFKAD